MGFLFDTVINTIPADNALELTKEAIEAMDKQEHVWSLHPQRPSGPVYVGTRLVNEGYAYDYYIDTQGVYWYESRPASSPIVTTFIYGGSKCKRYSASARVAGRKHMSA